MTLEDIKRAIIEHESNAWARALGYEPVYTAGARARIMIVGQAPGIHAQTTRIPWNDRSGDTLRGWLGMSREVFYDPDQVALVPMDFYYPGRGTHGDLPPRPDFGALWHPQLTALMPDIRLTLLVGAYAQAYYLGRTRRHNLTETVRAYQDYLPTYLPLVHPSPLNLRWRSRNPWFESDVVPSARALVQAILTT